MKTLKTFAEIDAARANNVKGPLNRIANWTLDRRLGAAERALALQILGIEPEDGTAEGRYVGSNTEFRRDAEAKLAAASAG